ncbi:MAG: hypothetical protein FWE01_00845 [Firmicutes bacterium]|nr:hypothetical protein [Bacillota bacterium]
MDKKIVNDDYNEPTYLKAFGMHSTQIEKENRTFKEFQEFKELSARLESLLKDKQVTQGKLATSLSTTQKQIDKLIERIPFDYANLAYYLSVVFNVISDFLVGVYESNRINL